jgi:hypothetical protein
MPPAVYRPGAVQVILLRVLAGAGPEGMTTGELAGLACPGLLPATARGRVNGAMTRLAADGLTYRTGDGRKGDGYRWHPTLAGLAAGARPTRLETINARCRDRSASVHGAPP